MNGTKTRLGMDTLEVRECPALLVGGDGTCGTPWPAPRPFKDMVAVSQVTVANPVATRTIIAINPSIVAEPDPIPWVPGPGDAQGLIAVGR